MQKTIQITARNKIRAKKDLIEEVGEKFEKIIRIRLKEKNWDKWDSVFRYTYSVTYKEKKPTARCGYCGKGVYKKKDNLPIIKRKICCDKCFELVKRKDRGLVVPFFI